MNLQLSKSFTLADLTRSQTATRRGIKNDPPGPAIHELRLLAAQLERVQEILRRRVVVSSGYRSPALNKAVGGAASSQHCRGQAADFTVPGLTPLAVARKLAAAGAADQLIFGQLILEFDQWVHLSLQTPRLHNQVLTARRSGGKTHYAAGLP